MFERYELIGGRVRVEKARWAYLNYAVALTLLRAVPATAAFWYRIL